MTVFPSDADLPPAEAGQVCHCGHRFREHRLDTLACRDPACWCNAFRGAIWRPGSVAPYRYDVPEEMRQECAELHARRLARDRARADKRSTVDEERRSENLFASIVAEFAVGTLMGVGVEWARRVYSGTAGDSLGYDFGMPSGRTCEVKAKREGAPNVMLFAGQYYGDPPASKPLRWDAAILCKWQGSRGELLLLGYVTRRRYLRHRHVDGVYRPCWAVDQLYLGDPRELFASEGVHLVDSVRVRAEGLDDA